MNQQLVQHEEIMKPQGKQELTEGKMDKSDGGEKRPAHAA